jgi:hypothetical protein
VELLLVYAGKQVFDIDIDRVKLAEAIGEVIGQRWIGEFVAARDYRAHLSIRATTTPAAERIDRCILSSVRIVVSRLAAHTLPELRMSNIHRTDGNETGQEASPYN